MNRINIFYKFIFIITSFFVVSGFSYSSKNASEEKLKTAFIFRFAEFIDMGWKHEKGTPVIFCIYTKLNQEKRDFYTKFSNRKMTGDQLKIIYNPSKEDLENCEIVYFTNVDNIIMEDYISRIKDGVITVSDSRYFIEKGGIIEFYKYRGKIGFSINNNKALESGIKFNAKLLELADIK